uniref:Uncharacterized protein AlNc14C355G10946 n=1 Tax=Albugo laibachii Nc14 TaxID=890382 RepID=F0WXJ5_9STRA|nr:conserved hypothetical protein [Albugo laibachii Nc14]|eukprot:CCA26189.1 conserved hypothetical protein [Albugo laibachii Nc14]
MSALSDEEQTLLHRDREKHPECFYSTALSSSCRAINGDNKCEFIRKIFRQCPNENKRLISERKDVTEGQGDGNELFDHQGFPSRDK